MPNNSSTGGPILPAGSPVPLNDGALDVLLQSLVVTLTGLPGASVRPRWQKEPPNMLALGSDWCAIGVTRREADYAPAVVHNPSSGGSDTIYRNEKLEVLTSFYGDNANAFAEIFREGMYLPQNRDALTAADMSLVSVADSISVPSLVNERWQYRVDMPVTFVRAIRRRYAILNLASVQGEIITDTDPVISEPINVTP